MVSGANSVVQVSGGEPQKELSRSASTLVTIRYAQVVIIIVTRIEPLGKGA